MEINILPIHFLSFTHDYIFNYIHVCQYLQRPEASGSWNLEVEVVVSLLAGVLGIKFRSFVLKKKSMCS